MPLSLNEFTTQQYLNCLDTILGKVNDLPDLDRNPNEHRGRTLLRNFTLPPNVDELKKSEIKKSLRQSKELLRRLHIAGGISELEIYNKIKELEKQAKNDHKIKKTQYEDKRKIIGGKTGLFLSDLAVLGVFLWFTINAFKENDKANQLRLTNAEAAASSAASALELAKNATAEVLAEATAKAVATANDIKIWEHSSRSISGGAIAAIFTTLYAFFRIFYNFFGNDRINDKIDYVNGVATIWENFAKEVKSLLNEYVVKATDSADLERVERLGNEVSGLRKMVKQMRKETPLLDDKQLPLPKKRSHHEVASLQAVENSLNSESAALISYRGRLLNHVRSNVQRQSNPDLRRSVKVATSVSNLRV